MISAGYGCEGFVFTDGKFIYKYLLHVAASVQFKGHRQFLSELAVQPRHWVLPSSIPATDADIDRVDSITAVSPLSSSPLYDVHGWVDKGPAAALKYGWLENGIVLDQLKSEEGMNPHNPY